MEDLTEKEQLEAMRSWWAEYGKFVIGGIVAGIAVMVGTNQYTANQIATQTEASELYEDVAEAVDRGNLDDAEAAANDIYTNYANTIYPVQTRLAMAKLYMDKGRDEDAATALREIVDAEPDSGLGMVARLRLAKVMLYQGKAQEVIDLLDGAADSGFSARFAEARGDAYVMLENYALAQDSYYQAMADSAGSQTVDRALLQMKLADLPDVTAEAAIDASEMPEEPAVEEAAPAEDSAENEEAE